MFKNKKKQAVENQIPADLFTAIHEPVARRKRWVVEIVVSLVIVVALVAGGMIAYKVLRRDAEPAKVPATSQTQPVEQSPQKTADPQTTTAQPDTMPASGSTNNSTVAKPQ